MNVKTIVKVMNFHALIRVDRARREANQYKLLEAEVSRMIDIIQNNRNLILDRWVLIPDKKAPRLRIYIGSDLGFCGAVNASVNAALENEDPENTVVVIGKKIREKKFIDLNLSREEFEERYDEIEKILTDGIRCRKYSGIDIFYDHFYNMSHMEPVMKTIFPIKLEGDNKQAYNDDFIIEGGNVNDLMEELIITYLNYEVKTAAVNAFASENIIRQNATDDSLKRIEETEAEQRWEERKVKNSETCRRVIDSYTKTKYRNR